MPQLLDVDRARERVALIDKRIASITFDIEDGHLFGGELGLAHQKLIAAKATRERLAHELLEAEDMASKRKATMERPAPAAVEDRGGLAWIATKSFTAGNYRYSPGCRIDTETLMSMPRFDTLRDGGYVKQVLASLVNDAVKPQTIIATKVENKPVIPVIAASQKDLMTTLAVSIRQTMELNGCTEQQARECIAYDTTYGGSRLWARAAAAAADDYKRKHPELGASKPNVLEI